ncbi:uncharacterized protein BYT42DRAFT_584674 [Radiomyces spectabilis]|uniref:uncharacterized protein n=1 Tax=Radiomyces spectabilis TaxID=64574 RepID=UPI0022204E8B|nr:uncharacterized protein BYT42DRAFT_584674 [Radiomyces spectabilis]KAI8369495.1 hypothetical protein BYT42DRAFT_584674 [Radiomyces spectabilis]
MKLSLFLACIVALLSVTFTLVHADALQDEIDAAKKKFCSGIAVTAPSKNKVFSNPKKVQVIVTRKPDAQAKVVNGVDIYSIDSKGKAKYLGTPWKGNYNLNKKATLTVDITKIKGLKLPSQFEFRVWVHNKKGPDCTLMSKVFKVKSSSHSNAAEEEAFNNLDSNIDRGCFGIDLTKPELGSHQPSGKTFPVQIQRDSASQVENYKSVELYKIDLETRQPTKVKDSWTGNEEVHHMFNVKESYTPSNQDGKQYAYFYKLSGVTQHDENCEFYSHPFYIDA